MAQYGKRIDSIDFVDKLNIATLCRSVSLTSQAEDKNDTLSKTHVTQILRLPWTINC